MTKFSSDQSDEQCTTEDRFREIARILAVGILRLRRRVLLPAEEHGDPKNLPESSRNGLEVQDETVLSVHTG